MHVTLFTIKDNLATRLCIGILQVASHVHPTDNGICALPIGLAEDEVNIDWLTQPVLEMVFVFDVEDLAAIALSSAEIGITSF